MGGFFPSREMRGTFEQLRESLFRRFSLFLGSHHGCIHSKTPSTVLAEGVYLYGYFCFFKLSGILGACVIGLDACTNKVEQAVVTLEMHLATSFFNRFTSFISKRIKFMCT